MNRSLPDIPKEWIQQARLADESAIEKIYSKTYPKAYTIAYYSLGATNKFQDEAQTITQDSMRKAFEKLDQLKDDDKFAPWMYTILNNSIRDYFRAHKNKDYQTNTFSELDSEDFRDNYEESIADDSVAFSPEANMNTELIAEGLKGCLDKLPDNQRFALMMQMYQQLTTKEIAEQMEVEENTVKSWIRRAKLSIKDMIEELRSQNKSFYTVAPLPFLAWMLDQELKNIPSFNAKAFADGVVMKVKADTINPQVKESNITNTSNEHELLANKKSDNVGKAKLSSEKLSQDGINKVVGSSVSTTGKVATGIVSKVVLGVAVFSVAAFGGYKIVATKYNKSVESEKSGVVSKKQNVSNEKKKDGFEKEDAYKNGVYRMTADLPVYNTRSKEDPYGRTVYRDTPGGDEIRLIHGIYSDGDGNYWAKLKEDKYVCVKDKDGEYIGEYLGDHIFVDDYVKRDYATYEEEHQDYVKYFTACGFEDPENVGGFGGSFPQRHDDQYNDWNYSCDGHGGTSCAHI